MKKFNIQKLAVAMALLLMPLMSFADVFPFVKLTSKDNKLITLRVGAGQFDVTHIRLRDGLGRVLYSETVENVDGILKNFDLSHLLSGHYRIELENKQSIKELPISVSWDSVEVTLDEFSTTFKPYIKLSKDGIVDFNFLNLYNKSTSVVITNDKGNVVYKGHLGDDSEIEKRFDISSLEKGNYHFIVHNGKRNFKHAISL